MNWECSLCMCKIEELISSCDIAGTSHDKTTRSRPQRTQLQVAVTRSGQTPLLHLSTAHCRTRGALKMAPNETIKTRRVHKKVKTSFDIIYLQLFTYIQTKPQRKRRNPACAQCKECVSAFQIFKFKGLTGVAGIIRYATSRVTVSVHARNAS